MAFSFDFNNVTGFGSGSTGFSNNVPFTYTEGGVDFTLSVTGSSGPSPFWSVDNDLPDGTLDGQLEFSVSSGDATFQLNFTDNGGNANLIGQIVLGFSGSGNFAWITSTGGGPNVVGTNQATFTPGAGSFVTGIQFTLTNGQEFQINSLTSADGALVCYREGTRIATETGETKVEELQAGDVLRTADGGTTSVKWLAWQTVDPRTQHPAMINPIRIAAGALAEGVPARDLFVSPDHAIEIDGTLYHASTLVNGSTITQQKPATLDPFRYYHVETEAHELLLAEGAPAESYLDMPARETFDNSASAPDRAMIAEMDLPRITSARIVPASVKAMLDMRAQKGTRRAA